MWEQAMEPDNSQKPDTICWSDNFSISCYNIYPCSMSTLWCKLMCTMIACWLEHRTHGDDWKVVSSNPWRSSRRIFFSRVNFVGWLLFSVCSTLMLLQWRVKDPGHSPKSAGVRLHLSTHTPFTQRRWSGLTMLLSRHSVGTYQETSSHATPQGTLCHSCLSLLSHCGLILAYRVELVCAC